MSQQKWACQQPFGYGKFVLYCFSFDGGQLREKKDRMAARRLLGSAAVYVTDKRLFGTAEAAIDCARASVQQGQKELKARFKSGTKRLDVRAAELLALANKELAERQGSECEATEHPSAESQVRG